MINSASVASYLVSAYIDCIEQLELIPQITVATIPAFDRKCNIKIPRLVNGLVMPDVLRENEYINFTVDKFYVYNRTMDHKFGVLSFNCFYNHVNTFFSLPVEHIVSVQSTDQRVKFDAFDNQKHHRFIILENRPELKLVK